MQCLLPLQPYRQMSTAAHDAAFARLLAKAKGGKLAASSSGKPEKDAEDFPDLLTEDNTVTTRFPREALTNALDSSEHYTGN